MSDRQVHARLTDGAEIVRYERAGKYYYEGLDTYGLRYRRLLHTMKEARQFITSKDEWIPGVPGGSAFDRMMKEQWGGDA